MTDLRPVFAVGFLAAAWNQERGVAPKLPQLFQGFRTNLWALLAIGVFFVGGLTVAVSLASLVDGGKLLDFMSLGGSLGAERFRDPHRRRTVAPGDAAALMLLRRFPS